GVADCPCLHAAPVALELRDDLHRTHLRRSGNRSRRKACAQQLEMSDVVAQLPVDLRNEMRDVRIRLDVEEPLDAYRSRNADARKVVTSEIDEHDVLGAILLRREQAFGISRPAFGRARDRIQTRVSSFCLDERFGRRTDQSELAELEKKEVRGRIDAAKRAVELRCGGRRSTLGAL